MRLSAYLLACIGLIQSSLSYADLSLLQARQQAFLLDPELQALNHLQSVDRVRLQQAGRLANPALAVEFDNLGAPSAIDGDGASVELRYSQDVSLNNKRALRVTMAQAEQLNTQLAIQKRSAALSAEVRLCLARWAMADARVTWQQDEQLIAQSQVRVLSEQLRAGKIVPSEYQRAVALAQETEAQVLGQQQMVSSARAECALLVGALQRSTGTGSAGRVESATSRRGCGHCASSHVAGNRRATTGCDGQCGCATQSTSATAGLVIGGLCTPDLI
jgi:outer membrane protein TolC